MREMRRWQENLAIGLVFFSFGMLSLLRGVNPYDESWFLQVLNRVQQGEVLYRDIFCGVLPLSVYLPLPLIRFFGAEVLVLKALVALCYAASAVMTLAIVRQMAADRESPLANPVAAPAAGSAAHRLDARWKKFISRQARYSTPWLAAPGLALLVWAAPQGHSLYPPLAYCMLMACMAMALLWRRRGISGRLVFFGGILAGLCFGAKQNIGVFAGMALAAILLLQGWSHRANFRSLIKPGALLAAGFALPVGILLIPVALSGGWKMLLDYGFTNKTTYVGQAGISYFRPDCGAVALADPTVARQLCAGL